MARVVHFEIPADDPERAVAFYRDVFGWEISSWGGAMDYRPATTGAEGAPGIDGAITHRKGVNAGVVNTIRVELLRETLAKVGAAGGQVIGEAGEVPGVGLTAYFRDSEGSVTRALQPIMPPG